MQVIALGIKGYKKDKACNFKVCHYEIIVVIADVIGHLRVQLFSRNLLLHMQMTIHSQTGRK